MKEIFRNKRLCFLGDSITQHGYYLNNMRWYMHNQKEKCMIFNRGIGGNRADMAEYLFEKEVAELNADYCFFCFGLNDLGCWLYDVSKEETEELLEERRQRNERFFGGARKIIQMCKEKNIEPVIMTPFAVNELLEEDQTIITLADNKEKAEKMQSNLYKRRTFKKINQALKAYSDGLKEIAQEENCLIVDIHSQLFEIMQKNTGLFSVDGIHYTPKGHTYIAKILLKYLGYDNIPLVFQTDEINEEIIKIETNERNLAFVQFNVFNKCNGVFSKEEMLKIAKEESLNENNSTWRRGIFELYINHHKDMDLIRDEAVKIIEDYLKAL